MQKRLKLPLFNTLANLLCAATTYDLTTTGRTDVDHFIQAFTGSHRFVVDYLLEEVLNRHNAAIEWSTILLR